MGLRKRCEPFAAVARCRLGRRTQTPACSGVTPDFARPYLAGVTSTSSIHPGQWNGAGYGNPHICGEARRSNRRIGGGPAQKTWSRRMLAFACAAPTPNARDVPGCSRQEKSSEKVLPTSARPNPQQAGATMVPFPAPCQRRHLRSLKDHHRPLRLRPRKLVMPHRSERQR